MSTTVSVGKVIAFWKEWSKSFLAAEQEPQTFDMARIMMICMGAEGNPNFPPAAIRVDFMYHVVTSRAVMVGLKLSGAAATLISVLCTTPGMAVMYVMALRYYQMENKLAEVTTKELAKVFPEGWVAEAALGELWGKQKGYNAGFEATDNVLDRITFDPEAEETNNV